MKNTLVLISPLYFSEYSEKLQINLKENWNKLKLQDKISADDFQYYIIVSSLFSSKIEGNPLDLDSFMNHRRDRSFLKKKDVEEIENLSSAYLFARENQISQDNFLKAHEILSKNLVDKKNQGRFRKHSVGVYDYSSGRPVYLAVEPEFVLTEISKLFNDISDLVNKELTIDEIFYFASMIHLWTAKIHPFADGNGRAARLLEKWFLSVKLGEHIWSVNSEKYYWDHRPDYYRNISLGYNYYTLNWDRCLPFLLMLPAALM